MYYNNILETIGNTPLVKINIKDRIAVKLIADAEAKGLLKPGGIIVEGTSGNTGMGLALVAISKGYKCIFTTTDKQSKEKMDILKAVGAEVIVCPTNVAPDDPRSYYSVAKKIGEETENAFYVNQYENLSNRQAHYESTGPELWKQTEGKITHLIVGVGTGGTISGAGKYLKEQNPDIQIIGEDIIPANINFDIIDEFVKVTDKDGALLTRRLAKEEGMFIGNSCGSAMSACLQLKDRFKADDLVVLIFHDHGSRYVGKMYNDEWMREQGWLED